MSKYKMASFFAGVGGIDLGFTETGHFETVYANEVDKYPIATYEANSDITVDVRSISDVSPDDVPYADIYLGGFPCQDISLAGYRQGLFNDDGSLTRSGLFYEMLRLIRENKPPMVFLENVKNLVSHNHGETFKVISSALEDEGYHLRYAVLNAKEYGNVPQNRERIYIVCFRDETLADEFTFPELIPLTKSVKDVIDFYHNVDERYYYTQGKYKDTIYNPIVDAMRDDDINEPCIYQWRRQYVRQNKSGVIPTLTANQGTGGHNVCLIKDAKGRIRKMTPRECFNAQGFPASFVLPSSLSDNRLYKQAGNSVCVPVVRRIAENIVTALDGRLSLTPVK